MLCFEPQYHSAVWGGRKLESELGRKLPAGPVGESWELCDLDNAQSVVASGPHQGEALGALWRSGALGGSATGRFPFLAKWLDCEQRTSVQVHPDAATCAKLGRGEPKSEAWYVVNTDPGAIILAGHYPGLDAVTLRQAATGGTIHKWLYEVSPKVGELLNVPAGTLHALGGGCLLFEVQEPSDTTFRVFDWKRVGLDGLPRTLHLDEACAAVHFDRAGPPKPQRQEVVGPSFLMRVVRGGAELLPDMLRVVVAEAGPVTLSSERGELTLGYGDVGILEPADGRVRVTTGSVLLVTEPPKN